MWLTVNSAGAARRWTNGIGLALAAALIVSLAVTASPASASPLTWSTPRNVDPYASAWPNRAPISCVTTTWCVGVDTQGRVVTGFQADTGRVEWLADAIGSDQMTGVSCPSMSLCVAIDREGDVVTSTNPPGGSITWTATSLASGHQMQTIACPSTSLCVATDDAGEAFTSTNPAGGANVWKDSGSVGQSVRLLSMSCPSASLCVGVGSSGAAVSSTNPTGGSAAWKSANADGATDIEGVSCPSTSLCVAVDQAGRVLTSTSPPTDAWTAGPIDGSGALDGISCPSQQLCVAADGGGNVLTSTNPAGGAASWSAPARIDPNASLSSVSCLSASFCIAGDDSGRVATATNPIGGPPSWTVTSALTGGNALNEMSCTSDGLCVSLDDGGRILTSPGPTATPPSWDVPVAAPDPYGSQLALSCASTSLCVAIGSGNFNPTLLPAPAVPEGIMSSTHPAGGASAWTGATPWQYAYRLGISCPFNQLCVSITGGGILTSHGTPQGWKLRYQIPGTPSAGPAGFLTAVSCSTSALCAATTDNGNVVTSTDPTGGRKKWKAAHIDSATSINGLFPQASLEDVSCTSGMMCAAVDNGGNVFTSTDPTGGARAWTRHNLNLGYSLSHIACPSISLCVALGANGNIAWSTNPAAGTSTWTVMQTDPGHTLTSLSCPSAKLCVVGDDHGNVIVGTGPGPTGVSRRAALAALTGSLRRSCVRGSSTQIRRRGGCPTAFGAPGPGQVTITWLGPRGGSLAIGQLTTTARGKRTVHVVLTAAGRRFLRQVRHTAVIRVRSVFVDAAGHGYVKTSKLDLAP